MARADGGCVGPLTVTPPGRSQAKANSPHSALRQPGGLRTSLCRTFPNFLARPDQARKSDCDEMSFHGPPAAGK